MRVLLFSLVWALAWLKHCKVRKSSGGDISCWFGVEGRPYSNFLASTADSDKFSTGFRAVKNQGPFGSPPWYFTSHLARTSNGNRWSRIVDVAQCQVLHVPSLDPPL